VGPRPIFTTRIQCKAKAIPLQAWTASEGSRRLRHPDFKTMKLLKLNFLLNNTDVPFIVSLSMAAVTV